jgi:glycosyltransferase involved in cell wall biosynthesis
MPVERSVLVPLPPVQWGGLQTFAANLSSGLRNAGWRWTVIIPPEAAEIRQRLQEAGVEVVSAPLLRFRRSPILTLRAIAGLANNVRALANLPQAGQATLVQAVGAHHLHGPMLASKLQRPLVWQIHSSILPAPLRRLIAPVISARADAVMTNGRTVAKQFWGTRSPGQSHFIFYAPVDTQKYAPNGEARAAARRELGCGDETVIAGTIGNHVWQKNQGFLVDAARRLSARYPRLRFLIMGAVHETYRREYQETVERPAAMLNQQFPGYITFLDPGTRVDYWLHALDIFTLTSHAEGVPIALFEAMCAAKPVISSSVGSIAEIVDEGCTGFLYKAGNQSALMEHLEKLFLDPTSRESMGQAGRRRIVEDFSIQRVIDAHVRAYEAATAAYARNK